MRVAHVNVLFDHTHDVFTQVTTHPISSFLALPAVYVESPHSPHYQRCLNDAVTGGEKGFWVCKRFCDATFALFFFVDFFWASSRFL